jgi:hypothetical protein
VVARAGGLLAVALLPLLAGIAGSTTLAASHLAAGFRTAVVIAGAACAAGGVLAACTIRNPARGAAGTAPCDLSCALDAAPLRPAGPPARRGA